MSREIRKVIPNYEHPRNSAGKYIPLLDNFEEGLLEFEKYVLENGLRDAVGYFGGTPNPEDYMLVDYRSKIEGGDGCYYGVPENERTWLQVFETVSEGTPDTPPFATPEELIYYLTTEGSLFHNEYPSICPILTQSQAEGFVEAGCAMSMMVENGKTKVGAQTCG